MYLPEQAIPMYDRHIRMVAQYLKKRRGLSDCDVSDLVQEGYIGLLIALKKQDPDREDTIHQYIRANIEWYMRNHANGFLSKNSRNIQTKQRALKTKWGLAQQKGLSFAEFAEQEGMTIEQCRASLNKTVKYISLDAEIIDSACTLHGAICIDDPRKYIEDHIDTKKRLQNLTPEQLVVIQLHYFEGLSLIETAERTGYSYEQVKRYNQQIQELFFPQQAQSTTQPKSAFQEADDNKNAEDIARQLYVRDFQGDYIFDILPDI